MNKTWLRLALAGLAVTSVGGALAIGCTGDDTTPAVLPDAGNDQNVPDTGNDVVIPPADGGDAAVPENAKVIVVHASPDVPAVRICFALGLKADGSDGVIAPIAPIPDSLANAQQPFPGLFPGTGGALPDLGIDLSTKALTPYVMIASKISTDVKPTDGGSAPVACDTLIEGDGGLTANVDFLKLPTIPAGALAKDSTLLLAATGCLPKAADPTASVARCGSSWNENTGNVGLQAFVLDRKVTDQAKMGAQVAHLSSPVEGLLQAGSTVGVNTALFDSVADASVSLTMGQKFGELKPATASAHALANASTGAFVVTVNNPTDGGAALVTVPVPLPTVAQLSTGVADAGYFQNGANYTFVILGDPTAPSFIDAGVFNGYSLHVLAFPNNPKVK